MVYTHPIGYEINRVSLWRTGARLSQDTGNLRAFRGEDRLGQVFVVGKGGKAGEVSCAVVAEDQPILRILAMISIIEVLQPRNGS